MRSLNDGRQLNSIADYGFCERNKILQKEVYTYAKEDNFNALFCLLSDKLEHVSSEEVLNIIFKHVAASGNSLLHVAASHGSEDVIQLLCHHFPLQISRVNFLGDNTLHLAARAGRFDTIQNLVNHVKNHHRTLELASLLRMKNNKGNTPLHDAVIKGCREVACFLLYEDLEVSYHKNKEDKSPLYLAVESCDEEMIASFIEAMPEGNLGFEPMDFLNEKGQNILHVAAGSGQMKIVDEILRNRDLEALVNEKDYDGNTPLHLAAMYCRSEIVRALVSDMRVDKRIVNNEKLKPSGVVAKLLRGGRFEAPKSDGMVLRTKRWTFIAENKRKPESTCIIAASSGAMKADGAAKKALDGVKSGGVRLRDKPCITSYRIHQDGNIGLWLMNDLYLHAMVD
ncbi:hypothetical protein POTOM_057210 [Populus tomentosa]|uniref:Ankyrin repeat family protein n=1 Tax=Populus tomentosa TaxID=118781 RepID=A0A8X7Y0G6_POPTO|nr:hypothetical protein POTOM_057210 [Populus tomentosa]